MSLPSLPEGKSGSKSPSRSRSPSQGRSKSPGSSKWGKPFGSASRSSSAGSFMSRLVDNPSLKVNLHEESLYLHPAPAGQPTYDPSVEGTVTLYLPKGRTLRHLSVKLVGICSIGFQHRPYETFNCLEKELTLVRDIEGDADTYLEKGEHIFSFSFLVPSNTAPYERNAFGRVRHVITAKAKGLGNLGDLRSNERYLYLIINPGGADESSPPPPLDIKVEGASEDLGPYTMALNSQHIMIAGLILFRIRIIGPPKSIAIHSIRLKVLQYFTLKTPTTDPPYTETPLPESRTVFLLDAIHPPNGGKPDAFIAAETNNSLWSGNHTPRNSPWMILKKGEEFKIAHLARFLNDNILRGTTLEGTEAWISLRHEIAVEVTYSEWDDPDAGNEGAGSVEMSRERSQSKSRKGKAKEPKEYERKVLVVTKPIVIFSCCSWLDSLTLPEYSVDDPVPPRDLDQEVPCTCGYPLPRIVERHGEFLKEIESEETSESLTAAPFWSPPKVGNGDEDRRGRQPRSNTWG